MKLTREQAIMEHRKMWNWIADETLRLKRRVPKDNYFEAKQQTFGTSHDNVIALNWTQTKN